MINDSKLYRELGRRLKALREDEANAGRSKMTQADLASAIGLERTSITNIEKGIQKLPLHVLYRMCEVFDVDVSSVLPATAELRRADSELSMQAVKNKGETVTIPASVARFVAGLS
jgi:DNA-binding XRE family transcriptional regulator